MGSNTRKLKRAEQKRRWEELSRLATEPGFSGLCPEAQRDYETGGVECCTQCHEEASKVRDLTHLSKIEDGPVHYRVCCAVRHVLCPNDHEGVIHANNDDTDD